LSGISSHHSLCAAILQGHQVAKLLAGEPIEVDEYSAITTSMIRSATRLGTQRRVKDVTPRLEEYLRHKARTSDIDDVQEAAE
jgi:hypothetical protein